jgi:hypothetical protein
MATSDAPPSPTEAAALLEWVIRSLVGPELVPWVLFFVGIATISFLWTQRANAKAANLREEFSRSSERLSFFTAHEIAPRTITSGAPGIFWDIKLTEIDRFNPAVQSIKNRSFVELGADIFRISETLHRLSAPIYPLFVVVLHSGATAIALGLMHDVNPLLRGAMITSPAMLPFLLSMWLLRIDTIRHKLQDVLHQRRSEIDAVKLYLVGRKWFGV